MVDLFTRHVELAPMRDQTANTILGTIDEFSGDTTYLT